MRFWSPKIRADNVNIKDTFIFIFVIYISHVSLFYLFAILNQVTYISGRKIRRKGHDWHKIIFIIKIRMFTFQEAEIICVSSQIYLELHNLLCLDKIIYHLLCISIWFLLIYFNSLSKVMFSLIFSIFSIIYWIYYIN